MYNDLEENAQQREEELAQEINNFKKELETLKSSAKSSSDKAEKASSSLKEGNDRLQKLVSELVSNTPDGLLSIAISPSSLVLSYGYYPSNPR